MQAIICRLGLPPPLSLKASSRNAHKRPTPELAVNRSPFATTLVPVAPGPSVRSRKSDLGQGVDLVGVACCAPRARSLLAQGAPILRRSGGMVAQGHRQGRGSSLSGHQARCQWHWLASSFCATSRAVGYDIAAVDLTSFREPAFLGQSR